MASNFYFLSGEKQFEGLYHAAVVAESSYNFQPQDPDTTIMLTRKALEYAVKWIYTNDSALNKETKKINVEKDPLSKLITTKTFRDIVGNEIYKSIDFLRILGNRSAHSFNNKTTLNEAEVALENLFIVYDFVYYCYSKESKYLDNKFDINIVKNTLPLQEESIDEDTPLAKVSEEEKIDHTKTRLSKKDKFIPKPLNLSEKETRKVYIDTMLREAGWKEGVNWINEYVIDNYKYSKSGKGKIDYALLNKEGIPIAIIEAKRENSYQEAGSEQAREYCIALEKKFGIRPVIFLSNGYNVTIVQEKYQPREIYGFYSEEDLLKTANILENRKDIDNVEICPEIANRYYQVQAVKSVCSAFQENRRKALLVMATGSGKTRTILSLVDVLSRYGWVQNVLFLADRVSLVKQAYNEAKDLKDNLIFNSCNISDEENSTDINYSVPFIFSTYQTMRNLIGDSEKNPYSVGHFDLIILDEAHRSIYNKYQDIFKYFDSMLVGLTATPKNEVGRNTYEIFGLENKTPTYGYELEQAVKDGYLVNYKVANYKLDILNRGIHYKDLSPEEKEEYEELFADDEGNIPESIDESHINRTIFNKDTIKKALQILLKHGLYINEGNTLGKTIIFARNHKHAELIIKIFRETFPKLLDYCILIDNYVKYHSSLITQFSTEEEYKARIAVSVDMLDTGVDIPDCLNLVFFKPVKSYSKFIQMIGRGTRLWKDPVSGENKTHFLIFDLCNNFEYFGEEENRRDNDSNPKSIMAKLFEQKLDLCLFIQNKKEHKEIYNQYKNDVHNIIKTLPENDISVRQNIKIIKEYSRDNALDNLTSAKVTALSEKLAPCVPMINDDIKSLKFDELIYNIMIANLRQQNSMRYINQLIIIADKLLEKKVPVVNKHKDLLEEIVNGIVTPHTSIKELENIRQILRPLVIYIEGNTKDIYITNFEDKTIVTEAAESEPVINTRYLENYKKKVEQELKKRCTSGVINKLYTNQKLSKADIRDLERILWQDLGTEEQYRQAAGQMPVTEFILSVTGLDNNIVLERFSKYINENNYNHNQIEFIYQLIENIRRNGFIKNKSILSQAPFSNYGGMMKLFNDNEIDEIIEIIDSFEVTV